MSRAIIYQDEKSETVFCVDGKIYIKNPTGGYIEARDLLKSCKIGMREKEYIRKLINMKYKEASAFHYNNQLSKGRKGKLFEGEFNDK